MSERAESTDTPFRTDTNGDEVLQCYRRPVTTIDDGIYQPDADGRFVAVDDVLSEAGEEFLESAVVGADRVTETIDGPLNYSRGDSEPGEGSTFSFTLPVPDERDE